MSELQIKSSKINIPVLLSVELLNDRVVDVNPSHLQIRDTVVVDMKSSQT